MNQNIEKIIVKFLMNAITIEELEVLTEWLKKPDNKKFFKTYVKTNYAMDVSMKQFDTENAKKEYLRKIRRDKSIFHRYKLNKVLKYAAVFIGVMISVYMFRDTIFGNQTEDTPTIVNTTIKPGTNKATLTLEDGSVVTLEKGNSYQTQNANSNGEKIVYKAGEQSAVEIAYNYLTVPRGGKFHITLSDGTEVWLNSESQLKYPVSFVDEVTREVELVYGEAYFNVSPSTEHKGSKFKVLNQAQEIEVLGTEFNIKAYKNEANIYTTLVEGKVSVSTKHTSRILKPNQQANLNLNDNTMAITTVNVYNEISWKEGVFSFRRKPLGDIMKVLSRWYDMDVEFVNPELKKEGFNGVLGRDQNIEDILIIIKNFGIIEDYEIIDKKIILK
ncbi:FecR family protein [Flavivirga eckloniae]|uniref:Anti-sigma factor n=1 Tax=Flavivirga eckloniae TaxID=1803846 RepID=A0A2K9PRB2_9FLAO|nr:FecR family protein [Flavivirga eckloniae]AUP79117.1 anti-sigma factor [Flavivirga eckloniae]